EALDDHCDDVRGHSFPACLRSPLASNASAIPSVRSQRLDAVSSPQAVARSVEEIASKLLMITEMKVGLRKGGLVAVREGFLGHRRGCQCPGNRGSAGNDGRDRRRDDQPRIAGSHDRLHPMNAKY